MYRSVQKTGCDSSGIEPRANGRRDRQTDQWRFGRPGTPRKIGLLRRRPGRPTHNRLKRALGAGHGDRTQDSPEARPYEKDPIHKPPYPKKERGITHATPSPAPSRPGTSVRRCRVTGDRGGFTTPRPVVPVIRRCTPIKPVVGLGEASTSRGVADGPVDSMWPPVPHELEGASRNRRRPDRHGAKAAANSRRSASCISRSKARKAS